MSNKEDNVDNGETLSYREKMMQLYKEIAALSTTNLKIVQIVINSKDVIFGLGSDGELYKYNYGTKNWEEI